MSLRAKWVDAVHGYQRLDEAFSENPFHFFHSEDCRCLPCRRIKAWGEVSPFLKVFAHGLWGKPWEVRHEVKE